jgi:MtaA/CmuA family methyltransferase
MAYPRVIDDVTLALRGERPKRMPFFACGEEMDVRLAGQTYENYATDAGVMAEVTACVVDKLDYDWAWLQIDDCIIPEILGVGVVGSGNILRATRDYLPATRETLSGLRKPDVRRDGRCPVLLDAIKRVKDRFGDSLLVVGRTEAPFSSATLLYGLEAGNMLIFENPGLLRDTMKFFYDVQIEFGLAQFEAGADALWYGDCNASSHLMSLGMYRDFALEPLAEVARAYRGHGITILHSSEEDPRYVQATADSGVDVISIGPGGDLSACHDAVAGRCAIMGNLDPIGQLMNGTPQSVGAETERILRTVSVRGGHLINSGEMVPRDTPEENMRAFCDTVRSVWPELARQM